MGSAFKLSKNAVDKKVNDLMSKRSKGALARDVYTIYQNHQAKQFASVDSNAGGATSEGNYWKGLSLKYRQYKPRRFAKYPESGERLLVATGTLAKIAVGTAKSLKNPDSGDSLRHNAMFKPEYMLVTITGSDNYAKYVNEKRTFMNMGDKFWAEAKQKIREYFK